MSTEADIRAAIVELPVDARLALLLELVDETRKQIVIDKPLTRRQFEIVRFIGEHLDAHGRPPTLREIGRAVGIASTNGVDEHLKSIERKGYIERASGMARGIRLRRRAAA